LLRQILGTLHDDIHAGVPMIGLEPACVAAFRDELVNLFPDDPTARRLAKQTIETLEAAPEEYIVTGAASCAIAIMHDYAHLLRDEPGWRERAERLAAALGPACEVWPAMSLDALVDRMGAVHGVIGVDSGPSHIAVALDLPHVQIYNFPTAWRTGPLAAHGHGWQTSVEGRPTPDVDAVWAAWQAVWAQSREAQRG
jgi:hypothetical protein